MALLTVRNSESSAKAIVAIDGAPCSPPLAPGEERTFVREPGPRKVSVAFDGADLPQFVDVRLVASGNVALFMG